MDLISNDVEFEKFKANMLVNPEHMNDRFEAAIEIRKRAFGKLNQNQDHKYYRPLYRWFEEVTMKLQGEGVAWYVSLCGKIAENLEKNGVDLAEVDYYYEFPPKAVERTETRLENPKKKLLDTRPKLQKIGQEKGKEKPSTANEVETEDADYDLVEKQYREAIEWLKSESSF